MANNPARAAVVGAGVLGSRIAAKLVSCGIDTTVVTRTPPARRTEDLLRGARLVVADVTEAGFLPALLHGVHTIVFAAGGLLPAESEERPLDAVGLELAPLLKTLEAAHTGGCEKFVFISSGGAGYGKPLSNPIPETHPTNPINVYGIAKLTAERFVAMHAHLHGQTSLILRCSNVYSEDQPVERRQGAVTVFLRNVLNGEPITLFGDGSVVRDYIYVEDVAEVVSLLFASPQEDPLAVLNVGSGAGTSLKELVQTIEQVSGRGALIHYCEARGFDIPEVVLDVSRCRAATGFAPMGLDQGLELMLSALGVSPGIARSASRIDG